MSQDVAARFNAAFPWFDHERWAWSFDPTRDGGTAYRIAGASRDALGEISIYMHGASAEQFAEVKRWLIRYFNPAREVPAVPIMAAIGQRGGGHNSAIAQYPPR